MAKLIDTTSNIWSLILKTPRPRFCYLWYLVNVIIIVRQLEEVKPNVTIRIHEFR